MLKSLCRWGETNMKQPVTDTGRTWNHTDAALHSNKILRTNTLAKSQSKRSDDKKRNRKLFGAVELYLKMLFTFGL